MTDYTKMEGSELMEALGDNAAKWAEAFCQIAATHGVIVDEGWMASWFANAIEHSHDVRMGRRLPILPDGSSFFIG